MRVKEVSKKAGLKLNIKKVYNYGIQPHHFKANTSGKSGSSDVFYFLEAPKSLEMVIAAMKLKDACPLKRKLWQS